jgi:hypothetical protein
MEKAQNNLKNFEKKYPWWLYLCGLYLSYLIGNFFNTEMTVYSIIGQLNMLFSTIGSYVPYILMIMLRIIAPLISVALFELFSRVFYALSNAVSFGAITMKSKDFVSALRLFVILSNIGLGLLNLLYYFFNFLIPLGMVVLEFAVVSTAYILFFTYIDKYYLDKKTAHRAFSTMAIIYLLFSLFNIAGGLLL